MALSGAVTVVIYFFLYETNAVAILQIRKRELQDENPEQLYEVEGVSDLSIPQKIARVCELQY
jgi:hypothetical protein